LHGRQGFCLFRTSGDLEKGDDIVIEMYRGTQRVGSHWRYEQMMGRVDIHLYYGHTSFSRSTLNKIPSILTVNEAGVIDMRTCSPLSSLFLAVTHHMHSVVNLLLTSLALCCFATRANWSLPNLEEELSVYSAADSQRRVSVEGKELVL